MGAGDPTISASCGEGFSGIWAIFRKAGFVFFLGIEKSSVNCTDIVASPGLFTGVTT